MIIGLGADFLVCLCWTGILFLISVSSPVFWFLWPAGEDGGLLNLGPGLLAVRVFSGRAGNFAPVFDCDMVARKAGSGEGVGR